MAINIVAGFPTVTNRYLEGNFAPVTEEVTATDLPVQGSIPRELSGRLLRNGPNPVAPDPERYHWFLGDAMLHGVELRDGRAASYRNRYVRTDAGGPPAVTGAAPNTHVVCHAGRILALVEADLPTEVTPELDTVGRYDFDGRLQGVMTAHPKIDPASGEMHFFGYNPFGPPFLTYHVADAAGALVRSEDIDIKGPAMVHDFAITETNVVWLDLPVVFDWTRPELPFPAAWTPEYGARVGVMPRDSANGDVRWFDVELCYVFHPLNAFDDGDDRVVIDVARHPTMFATDLHGPAEQDPTLDRWTIDLVAGKVLEERLDDRGQEFPRVDDRVVGRRHRFGYTAQSSAFVFGGLLKHDLVRGTTEVHDFGPGRQAGEGVFVAAADGAGEDEGWVLTVVYDGERDGSDLEVLDATDFSGPPVATVRLPQRVPFGFHGSWIPD